MTTKNRPQGCPIRRKVRQNDMLGRPDAPLVGDQELDVNVCIYIYIHIYLYIYTYIDIYLYTHMYTYVHMYVRIYTHVCI